MLPRDFYFCYLQILNPQFGFSDVIRLKETAIAIEELRPFLGLDRNWIEQAHDWLNRQRRYGHVLWIGHEEYPAGLLHLERPPLFLFAQGELVKGAQSLAIVGSREILQATERWMENELTEFLRRHPLTVISGGARGVDTKAHMLALRSACPTWIFLPSGLDQIYPQDWERQRQAILQSGGVFLTEYPLGTGMRKFHFSRRNELIVGCSDACLVMQAARRSGSMLTAHLAQKLGKPLATVPHFPHPKTMGGLDLLAEGATFLRDAVDLQVWCGLHRMSLPDKKLGSSFHKESQTEGKEDEVDAPKSDSDGQDTFLGQSLESYIEKPVKDND